MRHKRLERENEDTPGPGGYDIKSKAIEGKSVNYMYSAINEKKT